MSAEGTGSDASGNTVNNSVCEQAKRELRAHFKQVRANLSAETRKAVDARIAANAAATETWQRAETVLAYLSVGDEVDTRALIERAWNEGKTVAAPRCVPRTRLLQWHRIESFDGLQASRFGIEEPPDDPATRIEPATLLESSLALVPALAFDAHGFRLGYGGGFYDTFLADFPGVSAGLCREAQLHESLAQAGAVEPHDLPVELIITETGAVSVHEENGLRA